MHIFPVPLHVVYLTFLFINIIYTFYIIFDSKQKQRYNGARQSTPTFRDFYKLSRWHYDVWKYNPNPWQTVEYWTALKNKHESLHITGVIAYWYAKYT